MTIPILLKFKFDCNIEDPRKIHLGDFSGLNSKCSMPKFEI